MATPKGRRLDVAKGDGLGETFEWITSGDEFLADESLVLDLEQGFHDGRIVNLLILIQLATTGIAGGVDMTDMLSTLMDATYDVSVHDLHVINVEEKIHAGGPDLLDYIHAIIDMVPLISRMPFVWIGVIAGIEHFEANVDTLFLGMGDDLLVACHAVLGTVLKGNVFGVTGERYDVGTTEVSGVIDCPAGGLDHHVVILRIVETLDERGTLDRYRRYGAGEAMFLEHGPFLGSDQLDALATKLFCRYAHFLGTPMLGEAPRNDGLIDATFLDPNCLGFAFLEVAGSGMGNTCGG